MTTRYRVFAYVPFAYFPIAPHPMTEKMTSDEFSTYAEARGFGDRLIRSTVFNAVFVERKKPGRTWQILLADDSGDDA